MNILKWLVVGFTVFGLTSGNAISAQCGKKVAAGVIRDGDEVVPHSWPWLAALIFKSNDPDKNGKYFCSGTVISMKSVITAAHCMQEKRVKKRLNPKDFEVHLGRHDLSDDRELTDVAKVLEPIIIIAMHPDWNPKKIRYDADLALLIARKNIESSELIRPICLPERDVTDIENVEGTIVGWGYASDENITVEDKPRQAHVEKVPFLDCLMEDNDLVGLASKRAFCVKGVGDVESPCKVDSGGGFFVSSGNVWHIEGIISSAKLNINCPVTKQSLFTDLSSFTKWIERGINKFYEVQFTYRFKADWSGAYHELKISKTLRRGAFLSMVGRSEDLEVEKLWGRDQDWGYLPNNVGYMFPKLKELEAYRLKIKSIERLNFKNLERLEVLSLTDNLIEKIPANCFKDLKKLVKILVQNNKLKRIHADTFVHNPLLKIIDLDDNQIQPDELKNLYNANVEILWLESNQLESVPFDAFDGLPNLKKIFLNFNNLTTFHQDTFLKNLNLTELWAHKNQILNLPEGLFRSNKKLNQLLLKDSQITEIKTTFQSHGDYYFSGNICINKNFSPPNSTELMAMNEELQRYCGKK